MTMTTEQVHLWVVECGLNHEADMLSDQKFTGQSLIALSKLNTVDQVKLLRDLGMKLGAALQLCQCLEVLTGTNQ